MGKKVRYHFDEHTMRFEKIKIGIKERLKAISYTVAFGVVLALAIVIFTYQFVDSPKEKQLKREIRQYEMQYALLNERVKNLSMVLEDLQNRDDNVYRVIFESEPIPYSVRNAGVGGSELYADLKGYNNSKVITETAEKVDALSRKAYVQSKSLDEIFQMAKTKYERIANMPAILPVSKKQGTLISGFGMRFHPILHYMRPHTGVDISATRGTPVYATADGVVVEAGAGEAGSGYGIACVINHGYGYETLYGHLDQVVVSKGAKVKRGQIIGKVGNSGLSVAPHLHYEVIQNGKKVDPVYFFFNDLTPEEYEGVLQKAKESNQCMS